MDCTCDRGFPSGRESTRQLLARRRCKPANRNRADVWETTSVARLIEGLVAVRVGFEPTEPVKVQRFSRPPDSTALAPHRTSKLPDFALFANLRIPAKPNA